ncbi:MAG: hypothetical protein ACYDHN_14455 [Solirubrobacteraceae bacterium]
MSSRRNATRRALLIACGAAVGVGLVLILALSGGHPKATTTGKVRPAAGSLVLAAGTPAAFGYLTAQRSNRCGLKPAELATSPPAQHLQGSCCDPMDLSTYEWQVKALHHYASIQQIPTDPYDVPVSLARRLLRYDHAIHLSTRQQATYDRAMHMSREKGPCCCHCWRWTAFRGMSKYLIVRASWSAPQVALLIDDVEGCGGKGEPPSIPAHAAA